jgi:hypothetical protein
LSSGSSAGPSSPGSRRSRVPEEHVNGLDPDDVVATSADWVDEKPDPDFFRKLIKVELPRHLANESD